MPPVTAKQRVVISEQKLRLCKLRLYASHKPVLTRCYGCVSQLSLPFLRCVGNYLLGWKDLGGNGSFRSRMNLADIFVLC